MIVIEIHSWNTSLIQLIKQYDWHNRERLRFASQSLEVNFFHLLVLIFWFMFLFIFSSIFSSYLNGSRFFTLLNIKSLLFFFSFLSIKSPSIWCNHWVLYIWMFISYYLLKWIIAKLNIQKENINNRNRESKLVINDLIW